LSGDKGAFTAALEGELVLLLGTKGEDLDTVGTTTCTSALEVELGLFSGTKGGGVVCTSALEAAIGPIEGPSESSSFGSIGGTYDEDSDDAASTSSERVMFCTITDGISSSGRSAISAELISIPSSTSLI
jgi:hypothetical protein